MKIQILGSGSWGIALARLLSLNGHDVCLWTRSPEQARTLRESRENVSLLPGVLLPENIQISNAVHNAPDMVVYVVPSHTFREVALAFPFARHIPRISATKGIENGTLLTMTRILEEVCPGCPTAALSGPSHAEEVGRDLSACVVIASENAGVVQQAQSAFSRPSFRVYSGNDVLGVELGGALKNVMAIAAGACAGLGLGDNARAALITRGLAEMTRLGIACGARPETFAGLSGLGDLVVTCTSSLSRNFQTGLHIAEGMTLDTILNASVKVAEGIRTTVSAMALGEKRQVELPITHAVHDVLYNNADACACISALMSRLLKAEWTEPTAFAESSQTQGFR